RVAPGEACTRSDQAEGSTPAHAFSEGGPGWNLSGALQNAPLTARFARGGPSMGMAAARP
ncbi:MAG: hypothetical protein U9R79_04245, partial [Armatimonadota bacterium]|nr:hypothetical protein [Armatimonadota bacterium]